MERTGYAVALAASVGAVKTIYKLGVYDPANPADNRFGIITVEVMVGQFNALTVMEQSAINGALSVFDLMDIPYNKQTDLYTASDE